MVYSRITLLDIQLLKRVLVFKDSNLGSYVVGSYGTSHVEQCRTFNFKIMVRFVRTCLRETFEFLVPSLS
jgi:hypothetical protein